MLLLQLCSWCPGTDQLLFPILPGTLLRLPTLSLVVTLSHSLKNSRFISRSWSDSAAVSTRRVSSRPPVSPYFWVSRGVLSLHCSRSIDSTLSLRRTIFNMRCLSEWVWVVQEDQEYQLFSRPLGGKISTPFPFSWPRGVTLRQRLPMEGKYKWTVSPKVGVS